MPDGCAFVNTLRKARLDVVVQGAALCSPAQPGRTFLLPACLHHRQVLLWPHSLIKSQILAQRRGAQPLELSDESWWQLNMPSTSNDSWVRWEEQNDGEQQVSFACVFYTSFIHCPHQRAKAVAIKSTLWLDGNNSQKKMYFSRVQKEKS